jgi:hypothetical protein
MTFAISGLAPDPFVALYGLPDAELARRGAVRMRVRESPGFPDRIEMRDAAVGDMVLLVNHVSLDMPSPYRASHAIFVREGADRRWRGEPGEVPDVLRRRLLSLRGFDAAGMLRAADVVEGRAVENMIARLFADPAVAFIHAHNARQGCYAGRIDRIAA